jgi:transcriptional regulator with XRE-family HTH domain
MKILLNDYMDKKKLTERQVSRLTGLSRSTIHEIRTGAAMPRIDTLEILAKGLQIKIGDLVESPYI